MNDRDQPLQFFSSKKVFLLTKFTGDFGDFFACGKFADLIPTQSEQSPLDPFLLQLQRKASSLSSRIRMEMPEKMRCSNSSGLMPS